MIYLSMSVVRYDPGMLTTTVSLLSCASIDDVISTNSNDTVVNVASLFCDPSCYLTILSLNNISDSSVYSFYFLVMFATFMGAKLLFVCIWF